ncbi:hypothetical protein DPMN_064326 [Dreissena polymorpha]|uniref:Uncharacterized protein n=1 Tax=Dreissena polymorpha TaxID=45954 RepID=A0A9D4CC23_DREPO|nr:hypothetical protein DPMN_064326 [Dreissena polymorpha]
MWLAEEDDRWSKLGLEVLRKDPTSCREASFTWDCADDSRLQYIIVSLSESKDAIRDREWLQLPQHWQCQLNWEYGSFTYVELPIPWQSIWNLRSQLSQRMAFSLQDTSLSYLPQGYFVEPWYQGFEIYTVTIMKSYVRKKRTSASTF